MQTIDEKRKSREKARQARQKKPRPVAKWVWKRLSEMTPDEKAQHEDNKRKRAAKRADKVAAQILLGTYKPQRGSKTVAELADEWGPVPNVSERKPAAPSDVSKPKI